MVSKYDGEYPTRFEDEVFEYLSMDMQSIDGLEYFVQKKLTREYLFEIGDKFRQEHLWEKNHESKWKLKNKIS